MQMLSVQFFLFLIAVFPTTALLKRKRKYLPIWITIISLIFYFLAGRDFLLLTLGSLLINYLLTLVIQSNWKHRKIVLIIALIINVFYIATFKYWKLVFDGIFALNNSYNWDIKLPQIELIIPLGLSYYTFKQIAHLVEVYKRNIQKVNFFKYASYILFFPEVASGPITKPEEYYSQLQSTEHNNYEVSEIGRLLISAILKKWVLASYLYLYVEGPFQSPELYSSFDLVISMFAYSAMIYCDFSGYTDIAILVSRLLGFKSSKNFDSPYSSKNIKEFWSRWHITLSEWLKTYIYIPLGGNRKGKLRKYLNIFITMIVSGLWHGAGLTFLVWGLLHAIGTVFSHLISDLRSKHEERTKVLFKDDSLFRNKDFNQVDASKEAIKWRNKRLLSKLLNPLSIVGTTLFVSFAWIFFNSPDFQTAIRFISGMFSSKVFDNRFLNVSIIVVILLVFIENQFRGKIGLVIENFLNKLPKFLTYILLIIVIYLVLSFGPETMPPFIYFNF